MTRWFGVVSLFPQMFDSFTADQRKQALALRGEILATVGAHPEIGSLSECLKWGEPSYLTEHPKTGTTIRLSWREKTPNQSTLAVHCQTSLVASYRDIYGSVFTFEGSRAIIFERGKTYPDDAIRHCIALAQTYHLKT